ncbi:sensor histidine kinase [Phycicoccus sonneratiae]|uniref:histidine kinase n=1 Tax=Phycicoccus sonneratiae TaxID=2807628 RepID=A0ABS2CRP8_9MICO|nr:HAMP domain-containing sensor histidine kinase [Phycicoccus sonneraticus]MBM6401816.1 HAMP domain-containing histidine kinase [Phycicoccus sonneraticus]
MNLVLDLLVVGAALVVSAGLGWWLVRLRRQYVTAQREIARLKELAVRKADQVSVLSHEIRTPLALIKGSADLLVEETPGPLTDVQRRFATTISDSAEHVIALAEDLLAQARIEAGLFEVHLRPVELRAYLRSVVRELRLVHDREIVLDTPGPPSRVLLDPQLVHQLLSNLVANSLRHDPNPVNRVTVRGYVADPDVVIAISDRGRGMTEEQRAMLFERFRSSAALGEGTGIGLYISRHIVELHGGSIHVDTIAQHGTTMLVTFPAGGTA